MHPETSREVTHGASPDPRTRRSVSGQFGMAGIMALVGLLTLGGCIGIPPAVIELEERSRPDGDSIAPTVMAPASAFVPPADR